MSQKVDVVFYNHSYLYESLINNRDVNKFHFFRCKFFENIFPYFTSSYLNSSVLKYLPLVCSEFDKDNDLETYFSSFSFFNENNENLVSLYTQPISIFYSLLSPVNNIMPLHTSSNIAPIQSSTSTVFPSNSTSIPFSEPFYSSLFSHTKKHSVFPSFSPFILFLSLLSEICDFNSYFPNDIKNFPTRSKTHRILNKKTGLINEFEKDIDSVFDIKLHLVYNIRIFDFLSKIMKSCMTSLICIDHVLSYNEITFSVVYKFSYNFPKLFSLFYLFYFYLEVVSHICVIVIKLLEMNELNNEIKKDEISIISNFLESNLALDLLRFLLLSISTKIPPSPHYYHIPPPTIKKMSSQITSSFTSPLFFSTLPSSSSSSVNLSSLTSTYKNQGSTKVTSAVDYFSSFFSSPSFFYYAHRPSYPLLPSPLYLLLSFIQILIVTIFSLTVPSSSSFFIQKLSFDKIDLAANDIFSPKIQFEESIIPFYANSFERSIVLIIFDVLSKFLDNLNDFRNQEKKEEKKFLFYIKEENTKVNDIEKKAHIHLKTLNNNKIQNNLGNNFVLKFNMKKKNNIEKANVDNVNENIVNSNIITNYGMHFSSDFHIHLEVKFIFFYLFSFLLLLFFCDIRLPKIHYFYSTNTFVIVIILIMKTILY
jgi:hypothetical protein